MTGKEEKLKATYMAEATVSRVEAQLSQYLTKADVLKNLVEDGHVPREWMPISQNRWMLYP